MNRLYDKDLIIEMAKNNVSDSDIAKALNISVVTVSRRRREAGIVHTQLGTIDNDRVAALFEKQTRESAYWAGVIAADGCIIENKQGKYTSLRFVINQAENNKQIIENLSDFINRPYKKNVRKQHSRHNQDQYYIQVDSNKLCTVLKDVWNITPRKSFTFIPPKINKEYAVHWCRGYFDGDGSIGIVKSSKVPQLRLAVCGTVPTLQYFYDTMFSDDKFKYHEKDIPVLEKTGNIQLGIMYSELYKDSEGLRLDRKYQKFAEWKQWYENRN